MKKIIFFITFFYVGIIYSQDYDNKTVNIIRAKFNSAQDYFKENKLNDALEKIEEIELITGKPTIASALDFKIKILLEQNKLSEVRENLEALNSLDLSNDIIKNISNYNKIIKEKEELKAKEEERKRKEQKESLKKEIAIKEAFKHFNYSSCTYVGCTNGQVKKEVKIDCEGCGGDGKVSKDGKMSCSSCAGSGYKYEKDYSGNYVKNKCWTCYGSGVKNYTYDGTHSTCDGTGKVFGIKKFDCSVCSGTNKVLKYNGDYPFSEYEIQEIIKNNENSILGAIKLKKTFDDPKLTLLPLKLDDNLYGFLDKDLNIVINAQYAHAEDMNFNAAIVLKENYGVINEKNEVIIPFEYREIFRMEDGRFDTYFIANKFGIYDVFDNNGKIINKGYTSFKKLNEKLCLLKLDNSDYHDIFSKNVFIHNVLEAFEDRNKNIIVNIDNKFGLLSYNGKSILKNDFESIDILKDKIYRCKKDGKFAILDMNNLSQGTTDFFQKIENNNGEIIINDNNLIGYYYENGYPNKIIKPQYKSLQNISNKNYSYFLVATDLNSKKGVINKDGKIIIPFNFDEIKYKNANTSYECRFYCIEEIKKPRKALGYDTSGKLLGKIKLDK